MIHAIKCLDTGKVYRCMTDASADIGQRISAITDRRNYLGNPEQFEAFGYTWQMVDCHSCDKEDFAEVNRFKAGTSQKRFLDVMDMTTGEIYESMAAASRALHHHSDSLRNAYQFGDKKDHFFALGREWLKGDQLKKYLVTGELPKKLQTMATVAASKKHGRPVYNHTTCKKYDTLEEAAKRTGESASDIFDACWTGKPLHGCTWSRRKA